MSTKFRGNFHNISTFFLPSPCRKLSTAFTKISYEWTFKHGLSLQTKLPKNEDLQFFSPRNIVDTFKDYKTTDNKARNSKNTRLVLEMK